MSQLRNSKNVQCAASSAVYIGLKAEHLHASDMHATHLHSDDGVDVFETLVKLQSEVKVLTDRLNTLKMQDLSDVDVKNVGNGDALIYQDNLWRAIEIEKSDDTADETLVL